MALRFDPRTGKLINEQTTNTGSYTGRYSSSGRSPMRMGRKYSSVLYFILIVLCGPILLYLMAGVFNFSNIADIFVLMWGLGVLISCFNVIRYSSNFTWIIISIIIASVISYWIYKECMYGILPQNIDHGPGNDPETLGSPTR